MHPAYMENPALLGFLLRAVQTREQPTYKEIEAALGVVDRDW